MSSGGDSQGPVGEVESSRRGLFDRTFGTAAADVWHDPVLFLTTVGVALVTANGIHPIPSATPGDIALALATLMLVPLFLLRRPSYFSVPLWLVVSVAGLGLTVLLSTAANPAKASDFADGVKFMIALALTPLVIATVAASAERVALLADAWILGASVSAAVATTDFLGVTDIGQRITGEQYNTYTGRSTGFAATPNHLGLVAAMALPVALSRTLSTSSRRRALYIAAVVVLSGGVLSSGSRAALVAAAVGIVLLPLLHPIGRKQILLGFAVAVLALGVGAAIVPSARSHVLIAVHRLTGSDPSSSPSDSVRRAALRQGFSEFRAHPLTGNGFAVVRDAHDMYLQILDAGGIFALPAFLIFVGGVCSVGFRLRRNPELSRASQNLAAAFTASMGVWLACGIVSNEVYDRYLYLPAGLLLGLLFATRRLDPAAASVPGALVPVREQETVVIQAMDGASPQTTGTPPSVHLLSQGERGHVEHGGRPAFGGHLLGE